MTNTRASELQELQSYTELQSFESRASELQSYTELQSFESKTSNRGMKMLKTP